MTLDTEPFRVVPSTRVDLSKRSTRVDSHYESKKDYKKKLESQVEELSDLQERLFANDRHAVLLIFQAMDAAGKDGAIRHVMSGVNPQGCQVTSFKRPSANELDHDFLWRTSLALPERGRIGIFNRSYYEEVLVVRVHPEILRAQALPAELVDMNSIWRQRYQSIVDHETHLHRNGTRIVKFFLHVSKEEQRQRLIARIDETEKNWKFNDGDAVERKYWDAYMSAYEECLAATSTEASPWYVIPADDKENARLLISEVVVETLKTLKIGFPETSAERRHELQVLRRELES